MKKIGIFALFVVILASCTETVSVKFDYEEFKQERDAWKSAGVTAYQYEYDLCGEGGYRYSITVNGDKYSLLNLDNSSDAAKEFSNSRYRIEGIYDDIEDRYNEYKNYTYEKCKNDYFYYKEITVEYDKVNHIPIKVDYDYEVPEKMTVDGAFSLYLKNFKLVTQ